MNALTMTIRITRLCDDDEEPRAVLVEIEPRSPKGVSFIVPLDDDGDEWKR